ncbi:hypothetical protein EMIHUDRAFT_215428 [Emiliania huxleyi CCMP1516]|uniref:EF-hand domain-containing protein n=2 Tax=Emiliania huxleyi TaxID=2903 RepID=A0A0D3IHC7_EMIH1|nr:hypothetical protein EMIHUDRAFT_215428 [Emiliania huxleyi CCMP1516]EOD10662.1 hypothetical protein EMIHUDRAFT_215428 [Emiliania huxleyi CCMP1516]|eukprot:XP_005763091.1 hypothetical protein EMIHUDRAFT_215428 [Emiliania huxleyi CCMP1516]
MPKHAHLSEEELAEFREIFNLARGAQLPHAATRCKLLHMPSARATSGGSISKDELLALMNTLGLKPNQASGNGSASEFVTIMGRQVNGAAFKCFEESGVGSGHVTMAALERALTTYGSEKLPLADARALLSLIEPDSAGRVTCGGFGKPRRRL